jgi:hypothetical protein
MRNCYWLLLTTALAGCTERERIVGPTSGIGIGPEITITDPAQDITMTAGTAMLVRGTAFDEEGVDSIFFSQLNGPDISPHGAGGVIQASFSFAVNLIGEAGDTIIVSVYAANLQHVRGDLVTRRIQLR